MVLQAEVDSENIDDWPQKVIDAENNRQMEAASTGFAVMQENIAQRATDRGTMGQDAFPPQERDGRIVYGVGGTSASYALAQEEGTGPYTPPIEPLLEWGERTFGPQDPSTEEVLERINNDNWGPDLFAHGGLAVWSKIRGEGIKEKSFMKDSLDVVADVLNGADIDEYINEEVGGV